MQVLAQVVPELVLVRVALVQDLVQVMVVPPIDRDTRRCPTCHVDRSKTPSKLQLSHQLKLLSR